MLKKILSTAVALLFIAGVIGATGTANHAFAKSITKDDAAKIVTDKYSGDIINVEKEHDDDNNGNLVYEVEVKNSKKGRIEVDVDASSGKIVGFEKDDDDDSGDQSSKDQSDDNASKQTMISKDKAAQIATNKYGGDPISVEKEHENGKLVYEIEIKNSKEGRIEVDVDAATGNIVDMEKEDNDSQDKNSSTNHSSGNNSGDGTATDQSGNNHSGHQKGGKLAQTASEYPGGILFGAIIVIGGGLLLLFRRRFSHN